MLQANEIQQRFSSIEQAIGQANQACQSASNAPSQLKDCIERLDRETSAARQVLQSSDQARIVQCVDDLESIGDEAKRVCRTEAQMEPRLKEAVTRVHDELSDLKHQLH